VIGGGFGNSVRSFDGFVGGGRLNAILSGGSFSSIVGGDQNTVEANTPNAVIGGGFANIAAGYSSVIGGGYQNTNAGDFSVIGGGVQNSITNLINAATIAGGAGNSASAFGATVGGGSANLAGGSGSTVPGGSANLALGENSFAAGFAAFALHDGSFVWSDFVSGPVIQSTTNNEFSVRARGGVRFITSGAGISLDGMQLASSGTGISLNGQPILTGQPAAEDSTHSGIVTVANGSPSNSVSSGVYGATISGGGAANYNGSSGANTVTADFGTVSGGKKNTSSGMFSTVGGGDSNVASGHNATVGGGFDNTASGVSATIGGGVDNTASGQFATVPGGTRNSASGPFSLAAGQGASAAHSGSFVWADASSSFTFGSTAPNQFLIRAAGGVGIGAPNPQAPLHIQRAGPVMLLQDTASAANQAGYIGFWNNASAETGWMGFGTPGSPNFSIRNARSSGHILLLPGTSGRVGVRRTPTANALEVEGTASKTAAGSWLANSDARIKTGVRTVTGALDKLSQVRLVEFRYTDEYRAQHPDLKDRSYLNVIAQEFQKVFPDDVQSSGEKLSDGDAILQVDTYPLTIYSAAAIQELNHKLAGELKRRDAENAALKQNVEELKSLVRTLAHKVEAQGVERPVPSGPTRRELSSR
jgi:hypothetical protein